MTNNITRRLLIFLAATACLTVVAFGQERAARPGCAVVDAANPPLHITLSASQDRFRERGQVGLILRNNTNCSIQVEVYEEDPVPDAMRIFYDIHGRGRGAPEPGNYRRCADCWEDLRIVDKIAGGSSIAFGVQKKHYQRRLTISVPFIYEWEVNIPLSKRKTYRVYFHGREWPEKAP
jgi:hypothetical protein